MRRLIGIVVAVFFFAGVALIHTSAQAQVSDLYVSGSGSVSQSTAYYSVSVLNNGPDSADDVLVGASTGLTSLTYVSISQGTCTISGNGFSCDAGSLAAGATITVTVQGQLPNFGSSHPDITFCGFAAGASTATDTNTSDNSVTICVLVQSSGRCVPNGNPYGRC